MSNRDKLYWPDAGYTKGDLCDYYRDIGPWILPYLADRPLVLRRYPDGIAGKSFFHKDAPQWVPSWIRTETLWSKQAERDVHYFIADDADTLAFCANLGSIALHVWGSRIATLQTPDWAILDLDPKGAPMADVVRVALAIRDLCRDLALPCFVKTSGATGLHVLIPLAATCTFQQCRTLAELLARVVEVEHPDVATTRRSIDARGGRVYLDYVQNGHGRVLVAPFSARARPGAPVSMPLAWDEVTPDLDVTRFTIANAVARMRELSADPLVPVLSTRPDLPRALALLGERLADE